MTERSYRALKSRERSMVEELGPGSDGNFSAALGIPRLDGLGAEGGHGCSRNEFVLVESLPRRAALLAGLIAELPASGTAIK